MIKVRRAAWVVAAACVLSVNLLAQDGSVVSNGIVTVRYDLHRGTFSIESRDGGRLQSLHSAVETDRVFSSQTFAKHEARPLEKVTDEVGKGQRLTVLSRQDGLPLMVQNFTVYEGESFATVAVEIKSENATGTRHFTVLASDDVGAKLPGGGLPKTVLQVPYDNDQWVRFNAQPIAALRAGEKKSSAEVTAVYDSMARQAVIIGSITHAIWKTAIDFQGSGGALRQFEVYGGISSPDGVRSLTHNSLPHAIVTGTTIASPTIYVGFASDWRDGLERFANVNARVQPPLRWDGPPPVGWNSWAAYKMKVSAERYEAAAKFVHDELVPAGFQSGGRVYINYDSSWNSMPEAKLEESIAFVNKLNDKPGVQMLPGIYWTPFATWTQNLAQKVEGTNGKYTYQDIVLKGPNGEPLPRLANALPLDPTHPGTLMRMDAFVKRAQKLGFKYIKLDFVTHGALEGVHWDKKIETGNQAYVFGMQHLLKQLDGKMFVSLSIAPLFPSGLGHSRRLSCDAMGHIAGEKMSTEYMVNSLTYGWWTNGPLYISDPDHVPLGTEAEQGARSLDEGLSRFLSAVIGGGMILDSSDLMDDTKARELAKQIYARPDVLALAAQGRTFRPLTGDTGNHAASFFLRYEKDGSLELAVFNFSDTNTAHYAIPLGQLDGRWNQSTGVAMHDYWNGKTRNVVGVVRGELMPAASILLKLTPTK